MSEEGGGKCGHGMREMWAKNVNGLQRLPWLYGGAKVLRCCCGLCTLRRCCGLCICSGIAAASAYAQALLQPLHMLRHCCSFCTLRRRCSLCICSGIAAASAYAQALLQLLHTQASLQPLHMLRAHPKRTPGPAAARAWHHMCASCVHGIMCAWHHMCAACVHGIMCAWHHTCAACVHGIMCAWHHMCAAPPTCACGALPPAAHWAPWDLGEAEGSNMPQGTARACHKECDA